jgi:hypothetical protein
MSQIYQKIWLFLTKALFIITVVGSSGYCGIKEAHAYLRQNQDVIINALSRCHLPESPLFNFPCNSHAMNDIKTLLENNSVNDSIMELTVRTFLLHVRGVSNLLNGRRTNIISDSLSITFLSELINGSSRADEKECGLANSAAYEITRHVSYPSLRRYKKQINTAIMNSCIRPSLNQTIRIIIGPSESERQALLKEEFHFEDTPLKARLGDSLAIEEIRVKYRNAKSFSEKESAIGQVFVSGQIELIKMVIADFNNPMYSIFTYRTAPPCTARSTQFRTLQGLRRRYPEEKLVNDDFMVALGWEVAHYHKDSTEPVRQYLNLVTKWLERKYAIKVEGKSKPYIISRGCVDIDR